jgi:hypothetical protein
VGSLLEVAVHECRQGGVVGCQKWFEVGHVLVELGDEERWIHCIGTQELVVSQGLLGAHRT